MTKDNQEALECAKYLKMDGLHHFAAHIERLVAEYEDMKRDLKVRRQKLKEVDGELAKVEIQNIRLVAENEAKDALLRQAVQELEWAGYRGALVAAIRQHLEGQA